MHAIRADHSIGLLLVHDNELMLGTIYMQTGMFIDQISIVALFEDKYPFICLLPIPPAPIKITFFIF